MPNDTSFLEYHGTSWRVVVAVPRNLQEAVGATKLKRSLKTDSLKLANRLKWDVVAQLQRRIREAASGRAEDPLIAEALAMREAARTDASTGGPEEFTALDAIYMRAEEIQGEPISECPETGDPVYDSERQALAGTYVAIASGRETPLLASLARWHSENVSRKERTKGDDRRAIGYLEAWCRSRRLKPTIESIDRKTAGLFVTELPTFAAGTQSGQRLSNKTASKYLSCLSAYWKWMKARGVVEDNVWTGQSLPKERTPEDDKERAFRHDELKALFEGSPPKPLGSIMRIAALTGARIDAIVSLRVKDCQDGFFRFKPQKREEKVRVVPIHSQLTSLVHELTAGKSQDDDLFPEYPEPKPGYERSMPAVKAFTLYRRRVGVDEIRPGIRRSLVNFHSFRRWFVTEAERAGMSEGIIAWVVGHKRRGVTFGVYSGGPSLEQLRACVESVRLPL